MVAANPVTPRSHHSHSRCCGSSLSLALKTVRPSLLDLRFSGDAAVVHQPDGPPALCLGNYRLVRVEALSLDLPTLNQMLDRARHQRPRWQTVTNRYRSPARRPARVAAGAPG